ncbi:helix-hairpin-helix domain-containing protein [Flavobacterium sp. K5-23]|uniref:ComEA family DNA-binding protein n=1 Tax=Flavobacterium sp. K5-23 TaxID=2746225 RepID=UPI00200E0714|nr:helix-hairpin-helix domain-containing protein [Flavobacterium sp. K5-23]UQD54906.1 helix-hairpin-helix domain-containing protein [Flavobacterium sp. K5-23]
MIFSKISAYFKFSSEQRNGIFLLLSLIIIFQMICFFVDFTSNSLTDPDEQKWLSLQTQIDSLKENNIKELPKIYPYNPNFITDYKGYKLGMSVKEIDRLLSFRKENKYVNSASEFQSVTQVSDSLLKVMAPLFKFPDWVKNKKEYKGYVNYTNSAFAKKEKIVLIDINKASQEDLIKIYGIGEAISLRILKYKESLGGFVSMEQMNDVWGLSPDVITSLNSHFRVVTLPELKKTNINNASLKEISQFPYFKYVLAKEIVTYRSMNGDIKNIEDLIKIKGFPVEKAKIIGLYLDFN